MSMHTDNIWLAEEVKCYECGTVQQRGTMNRGLCYSCSRRASYVSYLNELSPPPDDEEQWTIDGKFRTEDAINGLFGRAIKRYDPIRFNVGFNEWEG